jgi:photosystem II stability/assembly factor-like uncharacterized protein
MEADFDSTSSRARVRRALTVIAVSMIVIVCAVVLYLSPTPPLFSAQGDKNGDGTHAAYGISAIDFVSPRTGWVVARLALGDLALLNTTDGGRSWTRQLSVASAGHAPYIKFFTTSNGVFALLGTRPLLYRTSDGGKTWTLRPALNPGAAVVSWSFVDGDHGWMLASKDGTTAPSLYRTEDGGDSWSDLGPPVKPPDQAFGIQFSYLTTGWLATAGSGPYAYRTDDSGATWSRVPLPAGPDFPRVGRFFVDVQQTVRGGAIASVVAFVDYRGRIGSGGVIRRFPPLKVPFYDGSRPNNYVYQTLINQVVGGPFSNLQAPRSELISSIDNRAGWVLIEAPAPTGTIGYADETHWWWINAGAWSSSANAGATWTQRRNVGVVEPMPGTLRMMDRSHAWLAGSSSPTLQTTSDGGLHWRRVDLPPLQAVPTP